MTAKKTTRQNRHQCAKRRAAGLKKRGRKPWTCPACGGTTRHKTTDSERVCSTCHPPRQYRLKTKQAEKELTPGNPAL